MPAKPPQRISRREFVSRLAATPPAFASATQTLSIPTSKKILRFGMIADIHPDMLPGGVERVRQFVNAMIQAKVDFILQLGDFCWPAPSNQPYLAAWNKFPGPRYHVLGNHDMDDGYTREQTVAFCGMPAMHYSFDIGPLQAIVLDGNEPGGKAKGYKRFVGPQQLAWLEQELDRAPRSTLLFIHQPFDSDHDDSLENGPEVRAVVEQAEKKRPGTIAAVFSGHLHMDYEREINGVRYLQINSAAYWWLNNPAARRETFPPSVHKQFRYLTHVAAYRDPLWSLVTIDLNRSELILEGRQTEWVGPDPWSRGESTPRAREHIHPWISTRRLTLNG